MSNQVIPSNPVIYLLNINVIGKNDRFINIKYKKKSIEKTNLTQQHDIRSLLSQYEILQHFEG